MNSLILGVVLTLLFFIVLASSGYAGYRLGQRRKPEKLTEEELKRMEQMDKGFQNVLNYDYSKALERRAK
jgi:hypothetical protein